MHPIPIASLGVLSRYEGSTLVDDTWTRSGNRLIRTGADGMTTTYDLDEPGRLISIDDGHVTYEYDGDRLVNHYSTGYVYTYTYDAGGNIADWEDSSGQRRVFDYSC